MLDEAVQGRFTQRRMVGYLVAAPTLVAGARWLDASEADAAVPNRGITDAFDLSDVLTAAALPTMGLLKIEITPQGGARFELPRSENGQGITTSSAIIVA